MMREPEPQLIDEIERAYDAGMFGDAWRLLENCSPPESWGSTRGRVVVGRLIGNLGASSRQRRLVQTTWRRDPADARARYYLLLEYHDRHGPVETLRLIDEWARAEPALARPAEGGDDDGVVWIALLRSRCLAQCRDFPEAEAGLLAAEHARPADAWTYVEKAAILEHCDRYPESLAAAERAVAVRPDYARAVWQLAHALVLTGREIEALGVLERGAAASQSPHLPLQHSVLLAEHGRLADSLVAIELASARFLLAERGLGDYLRSRRADLLHRLGRTPEAAEASRGLKGRYWETVHPRLAAAGAGPVAPRRQLTVPFVRQHHMTCAPATIAAVSAFLGAPVDHLSLAAAITYDGTPDHEERHWLESHGWCVREFRVTWETAQALIARDLPFTLVTTWVGSAHLQAVVGCDEAIGTLIIRDPYQREAHETLAAELLEQQAPFGPRGMVLVPAGQEARLAGVELPDAPLYDEWFRLRRALVRHERGAAAAAAERLQGLAPDSRLALWAQRQMAYYDDNPVRALSAVAELRARHPRETNLQLEEFSLLTRLGRRVDHRERVAAAMAGGKADPAVWREQIELWRGDARHHHRARRLARRYLRARPYDWLARATLAHTQWDAREFAPALKLYRLAATGGDKVEAAWQSYFAAARHAGGGLAALAMLRERQARIGGASVQPTITLARALEQTERTGEAAEELRMALERRPDDGALLLESALLAGRTGGFELAAQRLEAARGKIEPGPWRRVAARIAGWRGDHAEGLRHHEAQLIENPLDQESLAEAARLRALTHGTAAALDWLAERVQRHPHFLPLCQLRIEWLRDRPPPEALLAIDELLRLEPAHAWALRERALVLLRAERAGEALGPARLAEEIEPGVPQSPGIVGQALLAVRDFPAARAATERALRLDIAADWLIAQLVNACPGFAEREQAVEFLRGELAGQPAPTGGFLRFRLVAIGVLPPEKLAAVLEELRAARLETWEPWSACIQQAVAMGEATRAAELARAATERFPFVPRAWLDLADAHRLAGDVSAEEAALVRAREISPGWRDAAFRLSTLLQRGLRTGEAVRMLQAVLGHDPLDAGVRGRLAEVLWLDGQHEAAITAAERAAEAAPAWDEPWERLAAWWRHRGEPQRIEELARRVAAQRAGDVAARRQLARILNDRGDRAGALAEATEAARLAPLDADSHDLRAYLLALRGARDEALAACAPPALADPPASLRGRAAWVRWQFGERQGAIDAMRAVTAAHPDYAWGWQQLAEWHDALQDNGRAAEAAQKLAELRPGDATAWGWVASFKLNERDFAAAAPLLERALRLDPAYSYAAFNLLRIHAETSRWEPAEAMLASIRQHQSRWRALRCEIMLLRWRRAKDLALDRLCELARAPAEGAGELAEAADEVRGAGWQVDMERRLRPGLAEPGCNPRAAAIWMRLRLEHGTFARPRVRWLERNVTADAVRRAAWEQYLEWLSEKKERLVLRWHLWRRGPWLASADSTWASVGFVLTQFSWHRRLAQWMADWRERAGVEPWMLSNLAHALIALDRRAELAEVVAAALKLPADQTRAKFTAWAAWAAAKEGRHEAAEALLATFDGSVRNEFALLAVAQARAMVDVATAPAEERRARFREARAALLQAANTHAGIASIGYVARDHRRTLHEIARLGASPWRWWYAVPWIAPRTLTVGSGVVGVIIVVVLAGLVAAAGAPAAIGVVIYLLARGLAGSEQRKN